MTVGEGTADAVFTVSLSTLADREIRVEYATSDGSAVEGEDYLTAAGTVVFPAGTTAQPLAVPKKSPGNL